VHLESMDLNLLLAFDALATEGSVTKAAAKLNLSQPSMSGALARLRQQFGDPLFVRREGQMRPTLRARQLALPIASAIATLREALEPELRFRPETSTRTFLISATDYIEAMFMGPLSTALRQEGPRVSVRTLRPTQAFLPPDEALRKGEIDLALGLYPTAVRPRPGLLSKVLFRDPIVGIVRVRHPRAGRVLTLKRLLELPQIRVVYPGDTQTGLLDSVLAAIGHERDAALTVASIVAVPSIVARSDALGFAPEGLAREWAQHGAIRIVKLPIRIPDLPLTMVWHEDGHTDPAQKWLRDVVTREFPAYPHRSR
jgi:DNA-binding transcriptional LysR family regulator